MPEQKFENNGLPSNQKARLLVKDPTMFANSGRTSAENGMLGPLMKTGNGVFFPYSPIIQVTHAANYGTFDMTHTNYQPHYYINTPNPTISVQASFTAQSQDDAVYSAAALHFFKSCTKMDFGESNVGSAASGFGTAGTPPPVLLFSAYGNLHFKNVPVVIKSFSYILPENVDYVTFKYTAAGHNITVPTSFIVNLDLGVQHTPSKTRKEFSIQDYYSGHNLSGRGYL